MQFFLNRLPKWPSWDPQIDPKSFKKWFLNVTNFHHDFVSVFIRFWDEFPTTQTHKNRQNASEGYQKSENPSFAFTFEKWSQKVSKSFPIGSPKWSKWRPKNILHPCSKYHFKMNQKILILGSQMGEVFVFLASQIDLWRLLEPSSETKPAKTWKTLKINDFPTKK